MDIKYSFNPFETVYVNGRDILDVGAILESYSIGGTEIQNNIYQGRNRTNFNLLSKQFGRKEISMTVFFHEADRHTLTQKQSMLTSMLTGMVEVFLPDGFYYRSVLDKIGDLQILGADGQGVIAECTYTMVGIQHDELKTITGNTFCAEGTMWQMDCILTCTASEAYTSIQVGTVTFSGVSAGDVLVADGIDGRLLQNGVPTRGTASFTHLPYVVPGVQTISCPETLTVQYYPSYI